MRNDTDYVFFAKINIFNHVFTFELNFFPAQIFSLWTVSPRDIGGLSFSTEDAGQALVVAGIA